MDRDTFTVTCHIHKKSAHVTINKLDKSAKITGPGQKLWYDLHFSKRIAYNLYKSLMNGSKVSSQQSAAVGNPQTSTPCGQQAESRLQQVPVSPIAPVNTEAHPTEVQIQQQLASLMDVISSHSAKIQSLQEQVITLTTELITIKEQQRPFYASVVGANLHTNSTQQAAANETTQPPTECTQLGTTEQPINIQSRSTVENSSKGRNPPKNTNSQKPPPKTRKNTPISSIRNDSNTLILGSSIVKGINEKGLQPGVHVNGVSGGTIESISEKLQVYNLQQFSTIIIYAGGNDASNGTDREYFGEILDQTITNIRKTNSKCEVVVCSLCPRSSCDVSDFNEIIHNVALDRQVKSVPMEKFFSEKDHSQISRFFASDGIHLSPSGVRHLLDAIQKITQLQLVRNFQTCAFVSHQNRTRFNKDTSRLRRTNSNSRKKCFMCGEQNHQSFECRHRYRLRCHGCGALGHKIQHNVCRKD